MAFAPQVPGPIAAVLAHAAAAHAGGPPAPAVGVNAPGSNSQFPSGFGGGGGNPSQLVSQAIDLITRASAAERDPIEREGLAKIVALLHGFAAREQKQQDAAMGAGPAVQLLRRQG